MTLQKILLLFEPKSENLLPLLHKTNKELGYISKENLYKIAQYFKIAPARVYGVISATSVLRLKKKSVLEISVCNGEFCRLKGSALVVKEIEKYFGIKANRTNSGKVSLKTTSCSGHCLAAPVVTINGNTYEQVKPFEIDDILRDYS